MLKVLRSRIVIFLFVLLASSSYFVFSKKCSRKVDLSVVGYINMKDGLGRQGPELLRAFRNQLKVNFHVTRKVKGGKKPKGFDKYIADKPNQWGTVVVFEDVLWEPYGKNFTDILQKCPSKSIKFAYSMWESTRIPQEWVEILNQRFDAVIVPSEFLVEAYRESGVNVPIFIIPLALEFKHFFQRPIKQNPHDIFVFGNFSAGTDRKNHIHLIRAFHKAFGKDPSVKLVLNARYAEKEVRNAITNELALLDAKNIRFTQRALSREEYIKKFEEIDCYVSPSKGEGFSIQPREAMALGIPVIATDNTGQIDICKSGLVEVVKTPHVELARNPWGDYYGQNFNCEIDELAQAMIRMRDQYGSYLEKNYEAREWSDQFRFSNLKDFYASFIAPRKVVLGAENKVEPNCLTTDSLRLFFKYKKAFGKEVCKSDNENIFTFIYQSGEWGLNENGKGFSGGGSALKYAEPYMELLSTFIEENEICSVVDLGCGDWTFSKFMNWENIEYTGIDVVKFVIEQNQELYSAPNIRFIHADGTSFNLPKGELFVCKDVMQHLSNKDVFSLLNQIKKYKHCLITNDIDISESSKNRNIENGACRCIDLTKEPFNLDAEKLLTYDADGTRKVVLYIRNE